MDSSKIKEVLFRYEQILNNEDHLQKCEITSTEIDHLKSMIPKMKLLLQQGRVEKVMRWLGFMQGVFWTTAVYDLGSLKSHNRKD